VQFLTRHHKAVTEVVKIVGTICLTLVTVWGYFNSLVNSRIDHLVGQRMAVHEAISTGLALNQAEEFDKAARMLSAALDQLKGAAIPAERRELLYDGFLFAVANSNSPNEFETRAREVLDQIKTAKITPTPWRLHTVGWYLLHMGDLPEARDLFERARSRYDGEQQSRAAADPVRGLAMTCLANGDSAGAMKYFKEAKARSPALNDAQTFAKEMSVWPNEGWYRRLEGQYGDSLKRAYKETLEKLRSASTR
jgi:tetratricopeptide (TPR) repeat protein